MIAIINTYNKPRQFIIFKKTFNKYQNRIEIMKTSSFLNSFIDAWETIIIQTNYTKPKLDFLSKTDLSKTDLYNFIRQTTLLTATKYNSTKIIDAIINKDSNNKAKKINNYIRATKYRHYYILEI